MAVLKDGDEANVEGVMIGPVAWDDLVAGLALLGWTWVKPARPTKASWEYDSAGWLRPSTVSITRLERLADELAHASKFPVAVRRWEADVAVGTNSVDVRLSESVFIAKPNGTRARIADLEHALATFENEGGLADEPMHQLIDLAFAGLDPIIDGREVSGPTRYLNVTVPATDPLTSRGPAATLQAGDRTLVLDPGTRGAVEDLLRTSGRIDDEAKPPDLSRWTIRALRRAGFEAPPAPGSADDAKYQAVWLDLTAADRGAPGRGNQVPAWRWSLPGRWGVPEAEARRVADTHGLPAQVAEFLRSVGACEIIVG